MTEAQSSNAPENGLCQQEEYKGKFESTRSKPSKSLIRWVKLAKICEVCPVNDICEVKVPSVEFFENPQDPHDGNAELTLANIRHAIREARITSTRSLKNVSGEWRAWVAEDFEEYAAANNLDTDAVARISAGLLEQYLKITQPYPVMLSREFVDRFAAAYAKDVALFAQKNVPVPHLVAAGNTPEDYENFLHFCEAIPYMDKRDANYCLRIGWADPEKAATQYAEKVRFCLEELLPALARDYEYTDKLPSLREVKNICLSHPSSAFEQVRNLFESAMYISKALSDSPKNFFREKRLMGATLSETISLLEDATPAFAWEEITPQEAHYTHLTELRRAGRALLLDPKTRSHLTEKRLLERSLKRASREQQIAYSNKDIRAAANFALRATYQFNNLPEDSREEPLADDPKTLLAVMVAYLDDVASLRAQGVNYPESVARYHGRDARDVLAAEFPQLDLHGLNFCLGLQPMNPERLARELLATVEVIRLYVEGRPDFTLEPTSMMRIATRYRKDYAERLPELEQQIQALKREWEHTEARPFMIELAAITNPRDPAVAIRNYIKKFKTDTASLDSKLGHGEKPMSLYDLIGSDLALPEAEIIEQEDLRRQTERTRLLLASLSPAEQQAVAYVFDIPFAENEGLTEDDLSAQLALTTDLQSHVTHQLIPKLQALTRGAD